MRLCFGMARSTNWDEHFSFAALAFVLRAALVCVRFIAAAVRGDHRHRWLLPRRRFCGRAHFHAVVPGCAAANMNASTRLTLPLRALYRLPYRHYLPLVRARGYWRHGVRGDGFR